MQEQAKRLERRHCKGLGRGKGGSVSSIESVNQAVVKSSRARPVKFLERGTDSLLVMLHEVCRRPFTATVDSSH
jgi:hypothetical protein